MCNVKCVDMWCGLLKRTLRLYIYVHLWTSMCRCSLSQRAPSSQKDSDRICMNAVHWLDSLDICEPGKKSELKNLWLSYFPRAWCAWVLFAFVSFIVKFLKNLVQNFSQCPQEAGIGQSQCVAYSYACPCTFNFSVFLRELLGLTKVEHAGTLNRFQSDAACLKK